jgi:hypothetical protein
MNLKTHVDFVYEIFMDLRIMRYSRGKRIILHKNPNPLVSFFI